MILVALKYNIWLQNVVDWKYKVAKEENSHKILLNYETNYKKNQNAFIVTINSEYKVNNIGLPAPLKLTN